MHPTIRTAASFAGLSALLAGVLSMSAAPAHASSPVVFDDEVGDVGIYNIDKGYPGNREQPTQIDIYRVTVDIDEQVTIRTEMNPNLDPMTQGELENLIFTFEPVGSTDVIELGYISGGEQAKGFAGTTCDAPPLSKDGNSYTVTFDTSCLTDTTTDVKFGVMTMSAPFNINGDTPSHVLMDILGDNGAAASADVDGSSQPLSPKAINDLTVEVLSAAEEVAADEPTSADPEPSEPAPAPSDDANATATADDADKKQENDTEVISDQQAAEPFGDPIVDEELPYTGPILALPLLLLAGAIAGFGARIYRKGR